MTADELRALAEQVMALTGDLEHNKLDVQCEVALFKAGRIYTAVRANAAGTKVVYSQASGAPDVTCWAQAWTVAHRRASTAAALLARAGQVQP
ncbi:MAG: hypothetical protein KGQ52_13385 [Alphaproteobacteria bacterium]|nr:hypothetical protein [Alphaproteobacteria bacterium]